MKKLIAGLVLLLASFVAVGAEEEKKESNIVETKHLILYVVNNCGVPTKAFEFTPSGMKVIALDTLLKRGVTKEQIERGLEHFEGGPVVKIQSEKGPCINNI